MSERDTAPSEDSVPERLRNLKVALPLLVDLPRPWLITVALAALVSVVDLTIPHDWAWTAVLRASTTTLLIISLAWLPSLLRVLAVVARSVKFGGVEVTGDGLVEALAKMSPSTPGTVNAPVQQAEPVEPGGLEALPSEAESSAPSAAIDLPAWTQEREALYRTQHDLFLAHTVRPSRRANQRFDVAIYLVGAHGTDPTAIVERAEFYLGRYWGNQVIPGLNMGPRTKIGMTTSCFGPFLCICRVVLKGGGGQLILSRYIDFEMAWVFEAAREITDSAAA
jgi:hypothetical protein